MRESSNRLVRWGFEAWFAALALATAAPLFAVRYLPFQDLPQHAAAVRVLAGYADPGLGFSEFFEFTLGTTQYLFVYGLAALFVPLLGAVGAIKLVLALALASLPYALRALLVELGKPRAYALLCVPLAYNAHCVLGFVHFIAGLPCLFLGLALCARVCRAPSAAAKLALGLTGVICFYTHVVPYALLCLGAGLLGASRSFAKTAERLLPLGVSGLCALWWMSASPSGSTLGRLTRVLFSGGLERRSFGRALLELPIWLGDVFGARFDELALTVWAALLVAILLIGRSDRGAPLAFRLFWMVPLAWLAYFSLPVAYAFIWPINARFSLLAMLLSIAVLPTIQRPWRIALGAVLSVLTLTLSVAVSRELREIERHEYAGFGELVQQVPRGSRVVGLIFSARSAYLRFAPYLHAVAWFQAERGGVAMFTFAEFPSSPFRFREDHRPPRVPERWEWLPAWVDTEADLGFYAYAVTRGGPAALPGFALQARRGAWSLWRRVDTPPRSS